MIVAIYVDDIITATNNDDLYIQFKNFISSKFEIKDLGRLNYCLGVEFR